MALSRRAFDGQSPSLTSMNITMSHYRADINQHGTIIRMGIWDAVDLQAAEKIIGEIVWWATVERVFEVAPAEVARVRGAAQLKTPEQLALFV